LRTQRISILTGTVASILFIILITMPVALTYAGTPSEPHNADAMWVEPATVNYNTSNIGQKFNVTVSLNMTETIFSWQAVMYYNRTELECVAAGFTEVTTSNYCEGHTTVASGPIIDGHLYGNGSVLAAETCVDGGTIPGPHSGTLIWVEFQILSFTMPASGNATSTFDISKEYAPGGAGNTYVLGPPPSYTGINFTPYDGTYSFVPEFPLALIMPILMIATLAAVILSKKLPVKKPEMT
jgi:hypothetical protein